MTEPLASTADSSIGTPDVPADTGSGRRFRIHPLTIVTWLVVAAVFVALPFYLESFRVDQVSSWMTVAVAALGLNLLTGYNGQISVGHGALFGIGAYTTGLMITRLHAPLLVAVLGAGVLCFVVGVFVGLPALRIKGLYLALVTLSVATLFPLAVDQFRPLTGGNQGLEIRTEQVMSSGITKMKLVKLASPFEQLENDQWQYFVFLAVMVICFVLSRNLIKSRIGRAMVAIRDNETAAAVSGIPVARTKIYTFGVGSALAGIGGGLFAIDKGQLYPGSFTIALSIYFLVVVVIGGASSIIGPILGAFLYGIFGEVVIPQLPDRLQPARAVILGVLLIVSVLIAPGGVVGTFKEIRAKFERRKFRTANGDSTVETPAEAEHAAGIQHNVLSNSQQEEMR